MKSTLVHPEPRSPWRTRAAVATAAFALTSLAHTGCDSGPDSVVEGIGAPTVLQSSDVHVIGTSDVIAAVEDLEVLSDGAVWVLNSLEPFVIGFGPDGDVIQVHGSQGGGPEEFRAPTAFVSGGIDGQAWLFDPPRHALIEISHQGTVWSEISLSNDLLLPGSLRGGMNLFGMVNNGVRMARMGDEIILATNTGSMDLGWLTFWALNWAADLVALDLETGSAQKVISLGEALGDPTVDFERTDGGLPLWFRLWVSAQTPRSASTIDAAMRCAPLRVTGPSSPPRRCLPCASPRRRPSNSPGVCSPSCSLKPLGRSAPRPPPRIAHVS